MEIEPSAQHTFFQEQLLNPLPPFNPAPPQIPSPGLRPPRPPIREPIRPEIPSLSPARIQKRHLVVSWLMRYC